MREIKFRGKAVTGIWVYGGISVKQHGTFINNEELPYDDCCKVIPETVGQFTGLKDKDGREIYEGDVVTAKWYDYEEPNSTITGEVIFNKGWLAYCIWDEENKVMSEINGKGCYSWDIEVIGTIHDKEESN